ncbi:YgfZ/GcvT domain-containing protein [Undibacterium sp. SXout20W]|uniref:CAF17-like 4Fe-4S cluster assembly/insertion protein YgfZ n=1 Tax=Undibacterium sp. SXout20W TaxID=3413051 RepID=UPI003BF296FB
MSQKFLAEEQRAKFDIELAALPSIWETPAFASGYLSLLSNSGLILAAGDDSASFLHNQLSNDVEHLTNSTVRRAAYCTAKGRMLASLLYWQTTEGILLQLPLDVLPSIQKRLSMFVLRAKVKLSNESANFVVFGIGGERAETSLSSWFPTLPLEVNTQVSNEFGTLIRFNEAHQSPRFQWICPITNAQDAWKNLGVHLTACNKKDWELAEINAGIPCVTAKTQEKFVPQMINFELIGGVNFRKGCYPGQEIVARSQYLGKLKRRMALAKISASGLIEGTEVFKEIDPSQPCGTIVNVTSIDDNNSLALIEMSLADQEQGGIHCGSVDGPMATLLPLPYEIRDITQ